MLACATFCSIAYDKSWLIACQATKRLQVMAARYQDLAGDAVPVRGQPGVEVRVFSGASGGVTAPTKNFVPVTMVEVRLDLGASVG